MTPPRIRDNPFDCQKCGGRMQCIDTRPSLFRGRQSVSRRRVCEKCGWRFSTVEVSKSTLTTTELASLTVEIAAAAAKLDAAMEAVKRYLAGQPPPDDYDGQKDFSGSLDEGYRAVRERVAAGGAGWQRGQE